MPGLEEEGPTDLQKANVMRGRLQKSPTNTLSLNCKQQYTLGCETWGPRTCQNLAHLRLFAMLLYVQLRDDVWLGGLVH